MAGSEVPWSAERGQQFWDCKQQFQPPMLCSGKKKKKKGRGSTAGLTTLAPCSSDRDTLCALRDPRAARQCPAFMAPPGRQSTGRGPRERRRHRALLPRAPGQRHLPQQQRVCPDADHLQPSAGGRVRAAPCHRQLPATRRPDRGIDLSAHDQRGMLRAVTRADQGLCGQRRPPAPAPAAADVRDVSYRAPAP